MRVTWVTRALSGGAGQWNNRPLPEPLVSPSSNLLADGWEALRALRWADARTSFEGALAIEESADAFEGLSWAAWWLDDGESMFASRERAYHLYRRGGRSGGAARMATWLACDEIDFLGA